MRYIETLKSPYEFVPVEPTGLHRVPSAPGKRVFVHTPHDGNLLPEAFLLDAEGRLRVDEALLKKQFVINRDWGADRVARHLSGALGLSGFGRCRIARVLLDFNRFPGTSAENTTRPLDLFAISEPFGTLLGHAEKMALLEVYDAMSDTIDRLVDGALISIAMHTYDAHNASRTQRPDVSIVATPQTYFRESRMPAGLFDPIYPAILAESTCSRVLRDRISLNLERSGYRVSHNQPYALPEGSIEVRAQVWSFFRFLKKRFEQEHPRSVDHEAFRLVWTMLLNTNLRSQEGEALSGYLHRYRRPLSAQKASFEAARDAYDEVRQFVSDTDVVRDYRRSPERPSSLGIEVRKDLLVSFDDATGLPLPVTDEQEDRARQVAEVIAGAIQTYLETDREGGPGGVRSARTGA